MTTVNGICSRSDQDGLHFECGEWRVWETSKGYMLAWLNDGSYQGHKHYADLKECLTEMFKVNRLNKAVLEAK